MGDELTVPTADAGPEESEAPVLFWGRRHSAWQVLSNFAATPFMVDGVEFPTVEHYFQASKALTDWEREMVRAAESPKEAKRLGRQVSLRPDWESVKVDVMREALLAKFRGNAEARRALLSTGHRPIHEDSPRDLEWGWGEGRGRDLLGRLLMEVRSTLRDEPGDEG